MAGISVLLFSIVPVVFGNQNFLRGHLLDSYKEEAPGKALFLTPYIEQGRIEEAQRLAKVKGLSEEIESYSGYLTVDKVHDSNTFFWYFPSEQDPKNAPVLVWLQGGPGVTSLFGLFYENGPFDIKDGKLTTREYRWSRTFNLIYIDNPVGTGFSFTKSGDGLATNQTIIGEALHNAADQILKLFPHLRKNDFFISGESYAGKYLPAFGYTIHQKNELAEDNSKINLKGLLIGNGWTDPENMLQYSDFLYQIGFVDANERAELKRLENKAKDYITVKNWVSAFWAEGYVFDSIDAYVHDEITYNYIINHKFDVYNLQPLVTTNEFRHALHVGNQNFYPKNMDVFYYLIEDYLQSALHWVVELLKHYKVTFFNGHLDVACPFPLTENMLDLMEWDGKEDFKNATKFPWIVENEVAGYYREAKNLTLIMVRNAGTMVPADQPKRAFIMVNDLIFKGHL